MKYCSQQCASIASRRRYGVVYKGLWYGKSRDGYLVNAYGVTLHRLKWEEKHGPIPPGHVVHHRNGIKTDNKITNLELMDWSSHSKHHGTGRPCKRKGTSPLCSFPGCKNKNRARGLCTKHYQQAAAQMRGGWPRSAAWKDSINHRRAETIERVSVDVLRK